MLTVRATFKLLKTPPLLSCDFLASSSHVLLTTPLSGLVRGRIVLHPARCSRRRRTGSRSHTRVQASESEGTYRPSWRTIMVACVLDQGPDQRLSRPRRRCLLGVSVLHYHWPSRKKYSTFVIPSPLRSTCARVIVKHDDVEYECSV